MNLATSAGSLAITGYANLFNNATLYLYSGSMPASPETAATGTQLYSLTFASPAFTTLVTTGGYDTLSATFSNPTFIAGGTAGYGRVVMASPAARANTTAYVRGNLVTAASNLYVCTVAGTTSGASTLTTTNYGVADGTAAFDYVGVAASTSVLADLTVGTAGTDIILSTTLIASGVQINVSSWLLRVATV